MIRSMTSFGRSNSEEGKKRVFTVEMKSVNSRYLDVNIRMPKSIISLEEEIRKMISNSLNRGKVDVFITFNNYSNEGKNVIINKELAKNYINQYIFLTDKIIGMRISINIEKGIKKYYYNQITNLL